MLNDDKRIEAIISTVMDLQDRENIDLPLYEQQLRETETAINNLLNAIQQGILTSSTKQRLEELEATKEDLQIKIANEKLAKPRVPPEFVRMWLLQFRSLDIRKMEHRKALIDNFVNAIYLYNDKMVLTFNYKEGTKTVTFEESSAAASVSSDTTAAPGSDLELCGAPRPRPPKKGGGVLCM